MQRVPLKGTESRSKRRHGLCPPRATPGAMRTALPEPAGSKALTGSLIRKIRVEDLGSMTIRHGGGTNASTRSRMSSEVSAGNHHPLLRTVHACVASGFSRGAAFPAYETRWGTALSRSQKQPNARSRVGCILYPIWVRFVIRASLCSQYSATVCSSIASEFCEKVRIFISDCCNLRIQAIPATTPLHHRDFGDLNLVRRACNSLHSMHLPVLF